MGNLAQDYLNIPDSNATKVQVGMQLPTSEFKKLPMEFKLIENKEPFCGICFQNAGNKKQSALTKITSIKTNCSSYLL